MDSMLLPDTGTLLSRECGRNEGTAMTPTIRLFATGVLLIMLALIALPAFADKYVIPEITINNYLDQNPQPSTQTVENTTITTGISDRDLARGLAASFAAGGHQFDFSTTDWQGSITGAWQLSQEEENAVSFGIAKRFDRFARVLTHVNYTENGSDNWLVVGGTFRF